MMSDKFYHDKPSCHGNEIRDKIGYNLSCIRDSSEMLASTRGFSGTGYQIMSVTFGLTAPTLVAMATKFDTKQAITQLV